MQFQSLGNHLQIHDTQNVWKHVHGRYPRETHQAVFLFYARQGNMAVHNADRCAYHVCSISTYTLSIVHVDTLYPSYDLAIDLKQLTFCMCTTLRDFSTHPPFFIILLTPQPHTCQKIRAYTERNSPYAYPFFNNTDSIEIYTIIAK